MALPAFAAAAPAVQQSIDISCPPGPQQQTRRRLLQRENGTDRQTGGHRTVTYRPCSTYYAKSANNTADARTNNTPLNSFQQRFVMKDENVKALTRTNNKAINDESTPISSKYKMSLIINNRQSVKHIGVTLTNKTTKI